MSQIGRSTIKVMHISAKSKLMDGPIENAKINGFVS